MLISSGDSPGHPTILYLPHLSLVERRRRYGRGACDLTRPVMAGDPTTVTFTFEIEADGPAQVRLTYDGPAAPQPRQVGATYAYWVRVVQLDQARAWSSPVYITFTAGPPDDTPLM